MSTTSEAHAAPQSEAFVHGREHGSADLPHATLKGYLIGFFLSVGLTIVPFWLVMGDVLDNKTLTILLIMGFGVVQIFVHMIYFLHLNSQSEGGWNLMALTFTLVLVVIVLMGSSWIMYSANKNMMPMMHHEGDSADAQQAVSGTLLSRAESSSPGKPAEHNGH